MNTQQSYYLYYWGTRDKKRYYRTTDLTWESLDDEVIKRIYTFSSFEKAHYFLKDSGFGDTIKVTSTLEDTSEF